MILKTLFPGLTMNDCQGQRVTSMWPLHGCLRGAVGAWGRENSTLCQMDLGLSRPTLSSCDTGKFFDHPRASASSFVRKEE